MSGIIGYELKAQLHRSARTRVYRGRRESDGLPVVLKLMAEEYPSLEDATRFKREYEIGCRVSGEGAVVVLALEPVRSSWAIVMEDLGARTLRSLLEERRLPLEEALQLAGRLAAAVAAVHRRNVVHKDINPSNIVVVPGSGEVRLIDFGLASLLPRETGRMDRAIDHRSDLYSLGVTLYEMVTGQVPFPAADAVERVHQHLAQRPVPPHELVPEIPRPLSDVVMKLLARTAEDRYQSALGLKSDLDECLGAWRSGTEARVAEGYLLDLTAMTRAAQVISSEIMLEPLLNLLMMIMLENAGAQRGSLVLVREGRLVIEAELELDSSSAVLLSVLVEGSSLLSEAIVNFVARTRESVVLEDASEAGPFTQDPYVIEHRVRSVLCMPLLNQGRLVAILYLENNDTRGAFAEGRLEVLRLLSAQAALSLQNALLYAQQEEYSRTLEQRVEERTHELQVKNEELSRAMRQLRDTQKQLVAQEKLASLGSLTAGIAHELKNPLNFISNFAELSEEYAEELVTNLSSQRASPSPGEPGETLLQLRRSVAKIREHSHRANQIINGMLRHSRESSSTRASMDLNPVLAESLYLGHRAFRARVPGFEVDIRTDYAPGRLEVEGVHSELSRVFINLVDNACYALWRKRASRKEGFSPRLEVSTRDRGERVEVRIRDNGTGIPEELLGKVFHPFFTTKPAGEGTGLGLSLSHDIIVSGHQGTLRVESVEGEFTEFIIELPKRAPSTA